MTSYGPASGAWNIPAGGAGTAIPKYVNVALLATGGAGTAASPYTGWDSALAALIADGVFFDFVGVFQAAQNIAFDNHSNITVNGRNGRLPHATYDSPVVGAPFSQIVWSINGPNLTAYNTAGFTIQGLALKNTNPGGILTTAFTAYGGGGASNVSVGVTIRNCVFDVSAGGSGSPICCVQLDGVVEAYLDNNVYFGGQYGVEGIHSFSYSTVIHVRGGRFESQTQAPIHNPHLQWLIEDVDFEPASTGGPWIISSAGGAGAQVAGLTMLNCRQWDNAGAANVIVLNIAAFGITLIGCYTNTTGIVIDPANGIVVTGLTLIGNSFQNNGAGAGNGQLFPTAGTAVIKAASISANQYGTGVDNIAAYVASGNITDGTIVDSTGTEFRVSTQTTLAGTTAGTAVSSQPFSGSTYKKFIVYLNGYENTTATAQTITFPVAFAKAPYLAHDDSGGATVNATTLTLPASMSSTKTGWIVVEGY